MWLLSLSTASPPADPLVPCDGDPYCSGNGQCWLGVCTCSRGFSGPRCADLVGCPNECMGHGSCARAGLDGAQRACRCDPSWTGSACERPRCPADCSARGRCGEDGVCVCQPGYSGSDCSQGSCQPECVHGECGADFQCRCAAGWTGAACDESLPCAAQHAAALQSPAGEASAADVPALLAPTPCGAHGDCLRGLCFCEPDWFGVRCERRRCEEGGNCHGHGVCVQGECVCEPGWLPPTCAARRCPNDCSGWHGYCLASGVCSCKPGYGGADCAVAIAVEEDPFAPEPVRYGGGVPPPPPPCLTGADRKPGVRHRKQEDGAARAPTLVPWDDNAHNGVPQGTRRPPTPTPTPTPTSGTPTPTPEAKQQVGAAAGVVVHVDDTLADSLF